MVLPSANDVFNESYEVSIHNYRGLRDFNNIRMSNVTSLDFNKTLDNSKKYLESINNIEVKDNLVSTLKFHIADMSKYTYAQILDRRINDNYYMWLFKNHISLSSTRRNTAIEYVSSIQSSRFANPLLGLTEQVTNYYPTGIMARGFLENLVTYCDLF